MVGLSAYELERERNVQRNAEWLAANGLGGGVVPPKPSRAKRKSNDDEVSLAPTRASSRQSKKVIRFEQLGDDYFKQYEPDSEDEREEVLAREKSKRARRPATYFMPSAWQGVPRKTSARSTTLSSLATPTLAPASASANESSKPFAVASICTRPFQVTDDASVKPYYTAGKKGQCKRCLDWFCIRRDGFLHKHHCRVVATNPPQPLQPFIPTSF